MKKLSALFLVLVIPALAIAGGKDKPKYKSKPVKNPQAVTTASGLTYTITATGNGPLAMPGQVVIVHYTGKLTNDTVFDSSVKRGKPLRFVLGKGQVIKGWDEGFALLHCGDKATLRVPAALGYGKQQMGNIPANSELIFDVEMLGTDAASTMWDVKGLDTLKTASGLMYILVKKNPSGPTPKTREKVKVHYTGFFPDGNSFDSSVDRDEPISFRLGNHRVVQGWEEGFALLHQGEKARLIIPPSLGYGARQMGPIPPNSTLIFDVELLDIEAAPKMFDTTGVKPFVTAKGVKVYTVKKGTGPQLKKGNVAGVEYTGFLPDGTIFDSSILRDAQPYPVNCGGGGVINGWQEALANASVGDEILAVIPPDQAYGANGMPPTIPANATLLFNMVVKTAK